VVQEAYTPTTELDLDAAHIFPKKKAARFFTSKAWKITASSQRTLARLRKEQVDNAMRAMVQAQQERAVLLPGDLHAGINDGFHRVFIHSNFVFERDRFCLRNDFGAVAAH
jgi:hypothetical protein